MSVQYENMINAICCVVNLPVIVFALSFRFLFNSTPWEIFSLGWIFERKNGHENNGKWHCTIEDLQKNGKEKDIIWAQIKGTIAFKTLIISYPFYYAMNSCMDFNAICAYRWSLHCQIKLTRKSIVWYIFH